MSFQTQLYGLRLRSNCTLPGVNSASAELVSACEPADVRFELFDAPPAPAPEAPLPVVPGMPTVDWETRPRFETHGRLRQQVWAGAGPGGTFWRLWYGGDVPASGDFVIHPAGHQVWGVRRAPATVQDMTTLLSGAVFSCVLRLRGTICLHASAVAVGTRAVVILGEHGMGKSTTAAVLARRGHAILSDDLAVVTPSHPGASAAWLVHPGYPRLRLWPSTIGALYGPTAGLTPVIETVEKRYLELTTSGEATAWRFQDRALPLGAIYLLTRHAGLPAPRIHPIPAAARLTTLISHTSMGFLSLDQDKQAQEFSRLSRLSATVPVRHIHCPEGLEHLPALCDALVEDQSAGDREDRSGVTNAGDVCRVA